MLGIMENMSKQQLISLAVVLMIVAGYGMYMLNKCMNKAPATNTPQAFNEHFGSDKGKLIMFHVTWCGYCKEAVPKFKAMGSSYKGVGLELLNGEEEGKDLAAKYGVEGYPTIVYVKNGKHEIVNADRSAEGWQGWLDNKLN